MARHTKGFTLVELIIVVMIIAILAAILLVSYNGIQARAHNTIIVNGVEQYYKAIELYKIKNGHYPVTSREQAAEPVAVTCLGVGYSGGGCGVVTGVQTYEDGVFNQVMAPIIGNAPKIGESVIHVQGETFVGAVYGNDQVITIGPSSHGRTIQYALMGENANCVISGAYAYNISTSPATTACEIILERYPF